MDRSPTATRETEADAEAEEPTTETGLRARVGRRLSGLFSGRTFLVALALSAVGVVLGNAVPVPVVGNLAGILGVGLAGALVGLAGRSAYLEVALAGVLAAGVGTLLDFLVVGLATGAGTAVVALGAGAGAAAGVVGHYFGRDLRAGFTRDL